MAKRLPNSVWKGVAAAFAAALCLFLPLACPATAAQAEGKSVTAKIPVTCTAKDSDESFTYNLHLEDSPYQQEKTSSIMLTDGESGVLEAIYLYPGTYSCTVTQKAGTDKYTTYDNTSYRADIYVTETDDGTLFADPVVYTEGSSEKKAVCGFVNVRELPPPPPPTETEAEQPPETETETETQKETQKETEEETERETEKEKKKKKKSSPKKKSSSTRVIRRTYTYTGSATEESEVDGVDIEDAKTPLAQFRDAVKTGDPRVIVPFFILAGASLAVMIWAIARRRKDRQEV